MGNRQTKRSVDISSVSKKNNFENGNVATTDGKLDRIEEVKSITTTMNGLTSPSIETTNQQETSNSSSSNIKHLPEDLSDTLNKSVNVEDQFSEDKKEISDMASPNESIDAEAANFDKKKKNKKKWSFRSFSFSRKDKIKPIPKQEKQEETVKENSVEHEKPPPPLPLSPPPSAAEEIVTSSVSLDGNVETTFETDMEASGGGEALAELNEGDLKTDETVEKCDDAVYSSKSNSIIEISSSIVKDDNTISSNSGKSELIENLSNEVDSPKFSKKTEILDISMQDGVDTVKLTNGLPENDSISTEHLAEQIEN